MIFRIFNRTYLDFLMRILIFILFLIPSYLSSQAYLDSVFEFDVGDEFHYQLEREVGSSKRYGYTRNKIITKTITLSKVHYSTSSVGYFDFGGTPQFFNKTIIDSFPLQDTTFDTIPPCLDSTHPYFDRGNSIFGRVICNLLDTIYFDSNFNCLVYSLSYGAHDHVWSKIFAKKIGKIYDSDRSWTPLIGETESLVYYKDSSTGYTWGTPLTFNVGLNKLKKLDFSTFPNPTAKTINIQGVEGALEYSLINTIGQNILSGNLINKQIDCSILKNGIYLLRLVDENQNVGIKRIFISR